MESREIKKQRFKAAGRLKTINLREIEKCVEGETENEFFTTFYFNTLFCYMKTYNRHFYKYTSVL